jgi:hypothetical protein
MQPGEKRRDSLPEYSRGVPVGEIIRSILSIQHGSIQIIVQDSRVIQIDKTDKKRIVYKTDTDYSI